MHIACDVDGVVCATMEGFVQDVNDTYPGKRLLSCITGWDLGACLSLLPKQVKFIWDHLDWMELKTIPGAAFSLNGLSANHQITFITARDGRSNIPDTEVWLSRFLDNPTVIYGSHRTKAGIARDIGAEVLIEDRTTEVEACEAVGFPTILFHQPWNYTTPHPMRARSWSEIEAYIQALAAPTPHSR